jgi:hypothetical protein
MTESPEKTEQSPPPDKLMIDNPSDFQFHAAYTTYSEIFDKINSSEIKKQLNASIVSLQQHEIDFQTFYGNISRYRGEEAQRGYGRTFVGGQKKREWRRKMQKQDRIGRHRK